MSADQTTSSAALKEWPLWEVFVRSKQGLEHKHCGSLHAPPRRREYLGGAVFVHCSQRT